MISTQAPTRADASVRRPPATTLSATALARAALTAILSWTIATGSATLSPRSTTTCYATSD